MKNRLITGISLSSLRVAETFDRIIEEKKAPVSPARKKRRRSSGVKGLTQRVHPAPYASEADYMRAVRRRNRWYSSPRGDFNSPPPTHIRRPREAVAGGFTSPPCHPSYAPDRFGFERLPGGRR